MESDREALFKLPLAEFTSARNVLAKKLKQQKRDREAEEVRALAKPSVSAWAVNQLYWQHGKDFGRLLNAGSHLAKEQAAQLAGKSANLRRAIDDRRQVLSYLLRLADNLLRNAGHPASPDTLRRIETTLEALSTSPAGLGAPPPGYLTVDLAPLGFGSLAGLVPENPRESRLPDETVKKAEQIRIQKHHAALTERVRTRENDLHQAEENLRRARTAMEIAERNVLSAAEALKKVREELKDLT